MVFGGRGACACACAVLVCVLGREGGRGEGVFIWFLGEVKIRPIDIISSSLGYTNKSTLQTSHPSPSPTSLDTPAKPTD